MGTDINMFVEKKDKETGDWKLVYTYDYDDSTKLIDRNYRFFSALAGVRNRLNIIPVSKPKGLPFDVAKETKELFYDDHSLSWLGYDEVKNYDLSRKIVTRRTLTFLEWISYIEYGTLPIETTERENLVCLTEEVANLTLTCFGDKEEVIKKLNEGVRKFDLVLAGGESMTYDINNYGVYVYVEGSSYDELVGDKFRTLLKSLEDQSEEEDHSDVRIVFGFDC